MLHEVSDTAVLVDRALVLIIGTAAAMLALVTVVMVYFVVKYDRRRHPRAEAPNAEGGLLTEILWVAVPTLLVLVMFWLGWRDFGYLRTPPKDAVPVQVTAREWSWRFTYENKKESDVLRVPLNRATRLAMRSLDVIHSAYIPAFRIKEDVVPGMTTHLWFTPTELGSYDLFCTEYCGVGHSHMRATVEVVPAAAFAAWLAGPAGDGATELLAAKGCLGCHTIDGTAKIGPTFKGLYGSAVTVVTAGAERRAQADEAYLRRSILEPSADLVKGYPPIMPAIPLTEAELAAVLEALERLGEAAR